MTVAKLSSLGFQKRPTNDARSMPSLSFSLHPCQIDAIREASIRMQVSQSQVVREALDHFFPGCGSDALGDEAASTPRSHGPSTALTRIVRELAGVHRELAELRQMLANREAALSNRNYAAYTPAEPIGGDVAIESPAD
jgi:hypothetical protein